MLPALALAAATIAFAPAQAAQTATPNLAGNYRCTPQPSNCDWSGKTFTVTQTGNGLDVKSDKGDIGHGTVTSDISAELSAPWNMFGTISADRKTIEWSNGTQWQKL
jgi:hypothetical protein